MRDCDLIPYHVGADPHVNDPLGGWLETPQLRLSDDTVFQGAALMGIPLVWDLAGGYQVEADGSNPRVLEIHDNTMEACVRAYGLAGDPCRRRTNLRFAYRRGSRMRTRRLCVLGVPCWRDSRAPGPWRLIVG